MQFTLHDALAGGAPVGTPAERLVQVADGLFSVELDFGACSECFSGAARFLEVAVRPAGNPDPFVRLAPRVPLTAAPYAIRASTAGTAGNAVQLEGRPANGFIQNSSSAQAADFNVSGNGTIGGNLTVAGTFTLAIVNAQTQYNLAGQKLLAAGSSGNSNLSLGFEAGDAAILHDFNTLVGHGAGATNAGDYNTVVGAEAGRANTSGWANSFFGAYAGFRNTTGYFNAAYGYGAASANVTGSYGAFFGHDSGYANTADYNSFFGWGAGANNTSGTLNTFVGAAAGHGPCVSVPCPTPLTGSSNSFFGANAGWSNGAGSENSFFGSRAGAKNVSGGLNAFFGASAGVNNVGGGHNSFFGAYAGWNNTDGIFNSFFGRGAGGANTTGGFNAMFGAGAGDQTTTGSDNSFFGTSSGNFNVTGSANSFFGREAGLSNLASGNAFFGRSAGRANTTGTGNAFFGLEAGLAVTTGGSNSFFGASAGGNNTSGGHNTIVGAGANVGSGALEFATALGAEAVVSTSNTVVLGRAADTVLIPGNLNLAGSLTGTLAGAFILNSAVQQSPAEFNISGAGRATVLDAAGEFRMGGERFLAAPAPQTIATGGEGPAPRNNVLLGFGITPNLVGGGNTFVGYGAAPANFSGAENTFLGVGTGPANVQGSMNTLVGARADVAGPSLLRATALGVGALVAQDDSLVLGAIAGLNGASIDARVGIGTPEPRSKLEVKDGDVYVNGVANGLVLKSPNGSCFRLAVADSGTLGTTAIACP